MLHGFHAAAVARSRVQRNSVPSTHMRCMITANRRARATIAFFIPRRLAICIAQASLIGHSVSSAFRLSTTNSVDVAHGLVLLFGIGTKALPSWDSKARWNNLLGDLAVNVTAG